MTATTDGRSAEQVILDLIAEAPDQRIRFDFLASVAWGYGIRAESTFSELAALISAGRVSVRSVVFGSPIVSLIKES